MSSMSSGGFRGAAAKPPEKGVFPLDHFGECTEVAPPPPQSGHRGQGQLVRPSSAVERAFIRTPPALCLIPLTLQATARRRKRNVFHRPACGTRSQGSHPAAGQTASPAPQEMKAYLQCLKDNNQQSKPCRDLSKSYLECRMSRCATAFYSSNTAVSSTSCLLPPVSVRVTCPLALLALTSPYPGTSMTSRAFQQPHGKARPAGARIQGRQQNRVPGGLTG